MAATSSHQGTGHDIATSSHQEPDHTRGPGVVAVTRSHRGNGHETATSSQREPEHEAFVSESNSVHIINIGVQYTRFCDIESFRTTLRRLHNSVPGARGQGLGARAQVPGPRGLGSGAMGQRPGAWSCLGSGAWRQGPGARGQGPGDIRQGYDACARARGQGPVPGARLQRPRRHGPRGQGWVGIRMEDESGVSGAAAMQRNPPIYAPNGTWCPSFSPNYEKTTPNPKQGPNA